MADSNSLGIRTDVCVYLIHGASAGLRQRSIDAVIDGRLPASEREWGLTVLDATEVGAPGVAAQLGAASLMADARVVVVRNVDRLPAAAQTVVAKALPKMPPSTTAIFDVASSDDYRRKGPAVAAELRKTVEASGQVIEASVPDDRELPAWVVAEAHARGKTMATAVARAFVDLVGTSLDRMLNELDKLVTYAGPEQTQIAMDDVRQIVSGENESTVFDLVDALGRRDARAALSILPDLLPAQGGQGAAMPLLAMVSRQLRLVWQARVLSAAGVSLEDARALPPEWQDRLPGEHNYFDATKGRRFLVRKYTEQARNFSDVQLIRAMRKVYETDLALKGQGGTRMDDRLALETLIVSLCIAP